MAVPPWFSRLGLAVAVFALTTGFMDMVLGRLLDQPLFLATAVYHGTGPVGLFLYILVHNLGVAWMVFAVGSVAFAYEREPRMRRLIRRILLGSLLLSLLAVPMFHGLPQVEVAPLLFIIEAGAVLVLGGVGYWALKRAERSDMALGWHRADAQSHEAGRSATSVRSADTVGIAHALALASFTSFSLLALTAFIEVLAIAGVLG